MFVFIPYKDNQRLSHHNKNSATRLYDSKRGLLKLKKQCYSFLIEKVVSNSSILAQLLFHFRAGETHLPSRSMRNQFDLNVTNQNFNKTTMRTSSHRSRFIT